jgi:OOP family OmpA-OmpF porin
MHVWNRLDRALSNDYVIFTRGKVAMKKLILLLACGVGAVGAAQAQWYNQALQPSRYYVGLAASSADSDFRDARVTQAGSSDWNTSFKVFAGVEYDPFWGAEIGYTDLRTDDFHYSVGGVNGSSTSRGYGAYLAGTGRYPIPNVPQAEVYGKLGVAYSYRKLDGGPGLARTTQDDTGVYAAVGAQWKFTPQWAAVAEYERYGRDKHLGASADVLTVGLRFNF